MFSKRIKEIAKYTKGFYSLADIACDHGYLGIYAVDNFEIKECLLTDINELPLEVAKENVSKSPNYGVFSFALGDGLAPLKKPYDVIIIAGIGGFLMKEILANGVKKLLGNKRLILAPNSDSFEVRRFLMENHYEIIYEEIIFDYKYYEIIVAKPTQEKILYTDDELKFGPLLLKEKSKSFKNYYSDKLKKLFSHYEKVNTKEAKEKIEEKIKLYKKIL